MTAKQLFRHSLLPILAVLIIPNWREGTFPSGTDAMVAIIAGTITGFISCLWYNYKNRGKID